MEKFQAHRVIPKTDDDLMEIRMQRTENITQFVKRFWTIYSKIEDATDSLAIKSFKQALLPGNELRKDLMRLLAVTVKALMAQVNQFIKQEEYEA